MKNFSKAIELMLHTKGRCIVSGMGKSGHIGAKIAATLASTGTQAFYPSWRGFAWGSWDAYS